MYNNGNLEYVVSSSYSPDYRPGTAYFSKSFVDKYEFSRSTMPELFYIQSLNLNISPQYGANTDYPNNYFHSHPVSPSIFLNPSRPKVQFVDDSNEARKVAEEVFELMMGKELPDNISINVLPLNDFRIIHSRFGFWSNGILGFSINSRKKSIFVRENSLDELMIIIGHEIGHVLTKTLPNKHDEEAKAFAFSIKWAETIKKHNVANLGSSIKDNLDMNPARNGLHDVALTFVDFMIKKGRKAIELHSDFIKGYVSLFNKQYT